MPPGARPTSWSVRAGGRGAGTSAGRGSRPPATRSREVTRDERPVRRLVHRLRSRLGRGRGPEAAGRGADPGRARRGEPGHARPLVRDGLAGRGHVLVRVAPMTRPPIDGMLQTFRARSGAFYEIARP